MTPYRALVFTSIERTIGRGKRRRAEWIGAGYVLWNPSRECEPWRLPSSGSFLWPGLHAVRDAALRAFTNDPNVHQVSIRTNQDREVFRFYRQLRSSECPLFHIGNEIA